MVLILKLSSPPTPPEGLVCHDRSASLLEKVLEGRTANHHSALCGVHTFYWLTCNGDEWLIGFSVSTAVELHSDMSYLWAVLGGIFWHFKGFVLFCMSCSYKCFFFFIWMACLYWSMVGLLLTTCITRSIKNKCLLTCVSFINLSAVTCLTAFTSSKNYWEDFHGTWTEEGSQRRQTQLTVGVAPHEGRDPGDFLPHFH